jgi:hypothetical protein
MKKILIAAVILAVLVSYGHCAETKAVNKSPFAFLQGCFMGDEYVQYQSDLGKIEESYKKGEISRDKYLEMKQDAANNYKALQQH